MIYPVQETLFILGAIFQLLGIVLVGSPDLVPGAVRLGTWTRGRIDRASARLLRLIGRQRARFVPLSDTAIVEMTGSVSPVKSVNPQATLQERVKFLLARDQEAQRDVNALNERLAAIERDVPRLLDDLRTVIEAELGKRLEETQANLRAARLYGIVALLIGLALTTAASVTG
jgi:hypothetical protein